MLCKTSLAVRGSTVPVFDVNTISGGRLLEMVICLLKEHWYHYLLVRLPFRDTTFEPLLKNRRLTHTLSRQLTASVLN